jgi:tetratricopeptide (TPR) repeat protein
MGFIGKWYALGSSPEFDAGVRAKEKGEFDQAIDHFKACLKTRLEPVQRQSAESYLADVLSKVGRLHLDSGELAEAVSKLEEALEFRPNFADIRLTYAEALYSQGELDRADAEADKSLGVNPDYAKAHLIKAVIASAKGDRLSAEKGAAKAAELSPFLKSEASFDLGMKALSDSQFEHAASSLFDASKAQPSQANTILLAGDDMAKSGNWDEAVKAYEKAVSASPEYADIRCRLGQALLELNQVEEAMAQFSFAIEINESYAEAHALLGVAQKREGLGEEASASFKRALELDPNQPIAREESIRSL